MLGFLGLGSLPAASTEAAQHISLMARFAALRCFFLVVGLFLGSICTLLHGVIGRMEIFAQPLRGILCSFPVQMLWLYCRAGMLSQLLLTKVCCPRTACCACSVAPSEGPEPPKSPLSSQE